MTNSTHHFNLHLHFTTSAHQHSSSPRHESANSSTNSSATSSPTAINSQTHKHYESHTHSHIDTPYPVLEKAATSSSTSSLESTNSYLSVHKNSHHVHNLIEQLPNPVAITSHTVQDHITELHYGHVARQAKREARRTSEKSSHPWSLDAARSRIDAIVEHVEEVEDRKERDAQLWAQELEKREKAKRMSGFDGWAEGSKLDSAGGEVSAFMIRRDT